MANAAIGLALLKAGWRLHQIEIPDEPEAIASLSEEKLVLAAAKANAFGHNPDKPEKYEALYNRAVEIWGEYPKSLIGWYTVKTFWIKTEAPAVTVFELLHDRQGLKKRHIEFWEKVSERRKKKFVSRTDQYDSPEKVPDGVYDYLVAAFTNDDDDDDSEPITIEIEQTSP